MAPVSTSGRAGRERGQAHARGPRGLHIEHAGTRTRPVNARKGRAAYPQARAENEATGSVLFDYEDDVDTNVHDHTRSRYTHALHEHP
jgi:hypothetical protein